ncbi:MAG: FHA domain-containing protein, partial [Propionibacteriaceae bacterium]|nr:FHA domain-containing protein [Propionibacteriaceae bacterium]
SEIGVQLANYATEHGYIFNGPNVIEYEEDAKLPIGKMRVAASAAADVSAEEMPIPPRKNALFVEVNGVRHPITPPGLTIGRGNEVDLRINDPGISREHARINAEMRADGLALTVEDLGSTNGVKLNGQKVASAAIGEGDEIDLGKTTLAIVGANV